MGKHIVDKADALKMRMEGFTLKQIGDKYGVTPTSIHKHISKIINKLADPEIDKYKANKIRALTAVEMMYVEHLLNPKTVSKASANNAAYALTQAYTLNRLEQGLSTTNIDIHSRISDITDNISSLRLLIDKVDDDVDDKGLQSYPQGKE